METIDFVVTWVDGNDPEWQEEKSKYQNSPTGDARNRRYRDWETLRYWFRGVEKFAPWFNKVHFVTYGHLPRWLNTNHPKLAIVKHKDFIPSEYLPTFSCRPIELNLHKIKNLTEKFVYFNDDMFILDKTEPSVFFRNDLPCDTAILNAICPNMPKRNGGKNGIGEMYNAAFFNTAIINRNFNKRECIIKNLYKWFSPRYGLKSIRTLLLLFWRNFNGFMSYHLPYSLLKTTFQEVWEAEEEVLKRACYHKFRDATDVSSWLFSYWQLTSGKFAPRNPDIGNQFGLTEDLCENKKIFDCILSRKYKLVCINDSFDAEQEVFEKIKSELICTFERIFPEKSSFEI